MTLPQSYPALVPDAPPAPSSPPSDAETPRLRNLGVFNPAMLGEVAYKDQEFLVDGLLHKGSVNIAVGNSGLGKTPLLASLGIAVASGTEWLGRTVAQGAVLYIDGEMPARAFSTMLGSLSRCAGLQTPPPNFYVHSPNWGPPEANFKVATARRIAELRPALVIIDPLRVFFPKAEAGTEDAVKMIKYQRDLTAAYGCAWLTLHHRRKQRQDDGYSPALETNPHEWLQGASGSHALINQTDARLGIDASTGHGDLIIGGFIRVLGQLQPMHVNRVHDDEGEPMGYQVLTGGSNLKPEYQLALPRLPEVFRYAEAKAVLGGSSDSKTADFLKACTRESLVEKTGSGKNVLYRRKVSGDIEKAA